jgi:hypothetical protein
MNQGADLEKARAAKIKFLDRFAGVSDLNGVGIARVGTGFGVKVNLSKKPASGTELPQDIDGVPIVVEVVGEISKRAI